MFGNPYVNQHRYNSSKHNDNEDNDILGSNEITNDNDDVDGIIRPHIPEFKDDFESTFTIYHDWALGHSIRSEVLI